MRTKWQVLKEKEERLSMELDSLRHHLECLKNTPCNLKCEGCGTVLETEADFAQHFVIPDERFLNLGNCPLRDVDKFN